MEVQITPEPAEGERKAILAALAEEEGQRATSEWATTLLPERDSEEAEP